MCDKKIKQPLIVKCRLKKRTYLKLSYHVYVYICPIKNIKVGDWVIVEVTKSKMPWGFAVAKVEEILGEMNDELMKHYHPISLIIGKIACEDLEKRCENTIFLKQKIFKKYYDWDYNPAIKLKKQKENK